MNKCWCGNENLDEYSKDYYVCHECGTLITKREISDCISEVTDEEDDLYGSNYWTDKMMKLSESENIYELIQQYFGGRVPYWMQYILKYIPYGDTVAEVGCGLGQLSLVLKDFGFQQTAYEVSPQICDFLREEMGLNVVCGEFGTVNEIYEAIINFDLLEHLTDPRSFVKECGERLWGRSIFCCQTPCYTEEWSYEEMMQKKPEFSDLLEPDQHIYIFSKRAIEKLLREADLNILYLSRLRLASIMICFFLHHQIQSKNWMREKRKSVCMSIQIDYC